MDGFDVQGDGIGRARRDPRMGHCEGNPGARRQVSLVGRLRDARQSAKWETQDWLIAALKALKSQLEEDGRGLTASIASKKTGRLFLSGSVNERIRRLGLEDAI
jgi:hypothetical protein